MIVDMEARRCESILTLSPDLRIACQVDGEHDEHRMGLKLPEHRHGTTRFVPSVITWTSPMDESTP